MLTHKSVLRAREASSLFSVPQRSPGAAPALTVPVYSRREEVTYISFSEQANQEFAVRRSESACKRLSEWDGSLPLVSSPGFWTPWCLSQLGFLIPGQQHPHPRGFAAGREGAFDAGSLAAAPFAKG